MKIFGISLRLRKTFLNYVLLSHVQLFVAPWTVACQAPLSFGLCRQQYSSKLLLPGYLPDPGIEPTSVPPPLAGFFTISTTRGALLCMNFMISDIWSFFRQKVSNLEYYLIWHSLSNAGCVFVFYNIHLSVAFFISVLRLSWYNSFPQVNDIDLQIIVSMMI